MHKFITGPAPEGYEVDHINRNPSDNRRENLRFLTHRANLRNTSRQNHMDWDTITNCLYARIRWRDADGKEQRKRFSVLKLGLIQAHYEAMKFNDEFVKPLYEEYIKKHTKEINYPTQCTTGCRTLSPVCKRDTRTSGIVVDSRNTPCVRMVSSKC